MSTIRPYFQYLDFFIPINRTLIISYKLQIVKVRIQMNSLLKENMALLMID